MSQAGWRTNYLEAKVVKDIRGWSTDDSFMVAKMIDDDHSDMVEGGRQGERKTETENSH